MPVRPPYAHWGECVCPCALIGPRLGSWISFPPDYLLLLSLTPPRSPTTQPTCRIDPEKKKSECMCCASRPGAAAGSVQGHDQQRASDCCQCQGVTQHPKGVPLSKAP
uniref:Uncharacterized protein n=1 Tax=Knipowitschia caucasica TaxID=637954 RepID=A0AAV2MCM3_KNICA